MGKSGAWSLKRLGGLGCACALSAILPHAASARTCSELATLVIPDATISFVVETQTSKGKRGIPYCLVGLVVSPAINIWVGLPTAANWNHRFLALGGAGFAGEVDAPIKAVLDGFAGATTDTGHAGSWSDGSFALDSAGRLNDPLIVDYAYRAVHEMARTAKLVIAAYYGEPPIHSYWEGHSTGGRQGMMESQRFPDDFDGILAGAPAINWDRHLPPLLWAQVVMKDEAGGPIAPAKLALATAAATAACDALDGVVDGVLTDPRRCPYSATALVTSECGASTKQHGKDGACLTSGEAAAIDKIWQGPRDEHGGFLWYGLSRDSALDRLAGETPFPMGPEFFRYWLRQDPAFDWHTLSERSFAFDFAESERKFNAVLGTDAPDLRAFRKRGGRLVIWHGFADDIVPAEGSIDYYERVVAVMGGLAATQRFARLFMAPGVLHSSAGAGLEPVDPLSALIAWVELGIAPDRLLAANEVRSRPLCPYPQQAVYVGAGSTDAAASFRCAAVSARSASDE